MAFPTVCDPVELRRFNCDEYHRMAEVGILRREDHVELLEGIVFNKDTGEPRLYTVSEYHRMAEAGILRGEERVELIEGVIYTMSPIGSHHGGVVTFLAESLVSQLKPRAQVRVQTSILLPDLTEPEPDIAVVRPQTDYYRKRHPQPADIFILFEVMETSAAIDRGIKLSSYAQAGIPEVELVDLKKERIEMHRHPVEGVYTQSQSYTRGQVASCEAFPDLVLNVDDILG